MHIQVDTMNPPCCKIVDWHKLYRNKYCEDARDYLLETETVLHNLKFAIISITIAMRENDKHIYEIDQQDPRVKKLAMMYTQHAVGHHTI